MYQMQNHAHSEFYGAKRAKNAGIPTAKDRLERQARTESDREILIAVTRSTSASAFLQEIENAQR